MSRLFALALVSLLATGCASGGGKVEKQAYAKLQGSRTFEYDFPTVWNGVESAIRGQKVVERDPEEVDPIEMKNLTRRTLETDWVYTRSTEHFQAYKVNGLPRKTYLQSRVRYRIEAQSVMGGTQVAVRVDQEVEKLKEDGRSDGYSTVDEVASNVAAEMLEKIRLAVLSAP